MISGRSGRRPSACASVDPPKPGAHCAGGHCGDEEAGMLVDLTVQDLYWRSASIEPAPGGGSVTALCGMLGVALVLKALRISLKRREDAADWHGADQALETLAESLAADADADAESFNAFILAVR